MNSGRLVIKQTGLLALVLRRSFSRSTLGLRLAQEGSGGSSERCWVTPSCMALAVMGLSVSFFSTRQLYDDPNRQCLLWKK